MKKLTIGEMYLKILDGDVSWNEISFCYKLDIDFIEEFKDKLNWHKILSYQKLPEEYIEKILIDKYEEYYHLLKICVRQCMYKDLWYYVSVYQELSIDFLRKHCDKIDFVQISLHQELDEDFIHDFRFHLNWRHIIQKQDISERFELEHKFWIKKIARGTE